MKNVKKITKTYLDRFRRDCKEEIELFEKAASIDGNPEFMYELAKRFDSQWFKNSSNKEIEKWIDRVYFYDELLYNNINENRKFENPQDYVYFFIDVLVHLAQPDPKNPMDLDDLPQANFKNLLCDSMAMSLMFYAYLPQVFMPNFFVMQFTYIKKFAEKYDIDLPKLPIRSDYFGRCMYYVDLCICFTNFAVENKLTQAELCAFIFAYELPLIKEEAEEEYNKPVPANPEQAWILVGNYDEGERTMEHGFWQANQLTTRGDIMLFYEKSPVKKLNSVWIAQEDGVVDPFFYYYSNTYIGNRIDIPNEKAVDYADFKNSEYFKNRDKKGNFVSKNFQDCSGWSVTSEDYKEIKHMLEEKGFDTRVLPSLPEYEPIVGKNINIEADVSDSMLIPLLNRMGWEEGKNFSGEVEFPAGRGETGYAHNKRADFCLHMSEYQGRPRTKVLIEVKLFMKDNNEIKKAFDQGVSYAGWAHAEIMVLCDKNQIRVYEKNKHGEFDSNHKEVFKWKEMGNLERYNQLKRMLNI